MQLLKQARCLGNVVSDFIRIFTTFDHHLKAFYQRSKLTYGNCCPTADIAIYITDHIPETNTMFGGSDYDLGYCRFPNSSLRQIDNPTECLFIALVNRKP